MKDVTFTADEMNAYFADVFPQYSKKIRVEALGPMTARVRYLVDDGDLRPGETVSGPAMFALADCVFYAATLAMIGREALTVTTSANINFMRKPSQRDLIGEARILKLGRSLSVGDALIYSEGMDEPVAQASLTYSIPPKR